MKRTRLCPNYPNIQQSGKKSQQRRQEHVPGEVGQEPREPVCGVCGGAAVLDRG